MTAYPGTANWHRERAAEAESDDEAENKRADECGELTLVLFVLALIVTLVALGMRHKEEK